MVAENEKRIPVFDWETGDFARDPQGAIVTATELDAVEQIIIKNLQTQRGFHIIYADPEHPKNDHKYGNDTVDVMTRRGLTDGVRISEMKRAIREALIYDGWILDVYDIILYREGNTDTVQASFTVKTIFGHDIYAEGVSVING